MDTTEAYKQAFIEAARKSTARKIAIMQAWLDGVPVESRSYCKDTWLPCGAARAFWDWANEEYRIASTVTEKTKLWQWIMQDSLGSVWISARFFRSHTEAQERYPGITPLMRAEWSCIEVELKDVSVSCKTG